MEIRVSLNQGGHGLNGELIMRSDSTSPHPSLKLTISALQWNLTHDSNSVDRTFRRPNTCRFKKTVGVPLGKRYHRKLCCRLSNFPSSSFANTAFHGEIAIQRRDSIGSEPVAKGFVTFATAVVSFATAVAKRFRIQWRE